MSGFFNVYTEYLQSEHWRKVRGRVYELKGNEECLVCGSAEQLNVHHPYYTSKKGKTVLWRENRYHLVVLCRRCHESLHKYFNKPHTKEHIMYVRSLHKDETYRYSLNHCFHHTAWKFKLKDKRKGGKR